MDCHTYGSGASVPNRLSTMHKECSAGSAVEYWISINNVSNEQVDQLIRLTWITAYAPNEGQARGSVDSSFNIWLGLLHSAQITNIKPVTPSVLLFLQFFQILPFVSHSLRLETSNEYCGMSFSFVSNLSRNGKVLHTCIHQRLRLQVSEK